MCINSGMIATFWLLIPWICPSSSTAFGPDCFGILDLLYLLWCGLFLYFLIFFLQFCKKGKIEEGKKRIKKRRMEDEEVARGSVLLYVFFSVRFYEWSLSAKLIPLYAVSFPFRSFLPSFLLVIRAFSTKKTPS